MTPQQALHVWLVLGPVGVAFVAEMVLLFALPSWLARLAYVPVGRARRVLLTPAARAALSTGATYRDAAAGSQALQALVTPTPFQVEGLRVSFDPDGARATFRLPLGRVFAFSGAVTIVLRVDRDAIAMRARMLPSLAATGAAFLLPLILLALTDREDPAATRVVAPILATIFVALEVVMALRCREVFRRYADAVMDAVERRIAALG